MYPNHLKIGIIGSGPVGQTLAKAFSSEGHPVTLGTRDVTKPELLLWKEQNPTISISNFEEAAQFGDILVLATSGDITEKAIHLAGTANFSGKTVIDTTNPIKKTALDNGVLSFFTGPNQSLFEQLQELLPDAKLVKAFNSVGNALMYQPNFPGGKPTMFIAGNDEAAQELVTEILTAFGWETENMGKAAAARAIEPLAILWCLPGFTKNEWSHAFKLLKK